jgi:hypothetical protein
MPQLHDLPNYTHPWTKSQKLDLIFRHGINCLKQEIVALS